MTPLPLEQNKSHNKYIPCVNKLENLLGTLLMALRGRRTLTVLMAVKLMF